MELFRQHRLQSIELIVNGQLEARVESNKRSSPVRSRTSKFMSSKLPALGGIGTSDPKTDE